MTSYPTMMVWNGKPLKDLTDVEFAKMIATIMEEAGRSPGVRKPDIVEFDPVAPQAFGSASGTVRAKVADAPLYHVTGDLPLLHPSDSLIGSWHDSQGVLRTITIRPAVSFFVKHEPKDTRHD